VAVSGGGSGVLEETPKIKKIKYMVSITEKSKQRLHKKKIIK
jgi:hypothetical protein